MKKHSNDVCGSLRKRSSNARLMKAIVSSLEGRAEDTRARLRQSALDELRHRVPSAGRGGSRVHEARMGFFSATSRATSSTPARSRVPSPSPSRGGGRQVRDPRRGPPRPRQRHHGRPVVGGPQVGARRLLNALDPTCAARHRLRRPARDDRADQEDESGLQGIRCPDVIRDPASLVVA